MSFAQLAAEEALELTTHTMVGKAAVEAAKHGIAEVFSSLGMKRAASAMLQKEHGLDELEYLKSYTDMVSKGQLVIPYGEVGPTADNGFVTAANAVRAYLTRFAEGTEKAVDHFGIIPDRMKFPRTFVDSGIYTHDRTFNLMGPSTHRLVANLPEVGPGPLRYGDRVQFDTEHKLAGEYWSVHPKTEAGPTVIVKMDQNYFDQPKLNPAELLPIHAKLWRDEAGAVYSSTANSIEDVPDARFLKFQSMFRAVAPSHLKYLSGERPLPTEVNTILQKSDALIATNSSRQLPFLYALSSSPLHGFTETPLLPWKPSSLFNPSGLASNCMSCTAAVIRTLKSRVLTTADDIANVVSKEGQRMGEPYFGRFDDRSDALDWFKKAAGVRVVEEGPFTGKFKPGGIYALTMRAHRNTPDVQHMVFGHEFRDNTSVIFDGQSGAQLKLESASRRGLTPYFYKLKFDD